MGPGDSGVRAAKGLIAPDRVTASDFSTFPFISIIIYIPFLGVKVQSDVHYSSKKIISL